MKIIKFQSIWNNFFSAFFEDKISVLFSKDNFYENDNENILNMMENSQVINQRISYLFLLINNIILELLIYLNYKHESKEILNFGILTINSISLVSIFLFFFFHIKLKFFRSNLYIWIQNIQFDFIFIFNFIYGFIFLKYEIGDQNFYLYQILFSNFWFACLINVIFTRKIFSENVNLFIFLLYKLSLFGFFSYIANQKLEKFFFNEIFTAFFYSILFIYMTLRTKHYFGELKKIMLLISKKCEYYQSLLNMLNKSFLSFDISNYRINCNISFINFLKKLGMNDLEINYALDIRNIKQYNKNQEKIRKSNKNKDKSSLDKNLITDGINIKRKKTNNFNKKNTSENEYFKKNLDKKNKENIIIPNGNITTMENAKFFDKENSQQQSFKNYLSQNGKYLNMNEEYNSKISISPTKNSMNGVRNFFFMKKINKKENLNQNQESQKILQEKINTSMIDSNLNNNNSNLNSVQFSQTNKTLLGTDDKAFSKRMNGKIKKDVNIKANIPEEYKENISTNFKFLNEKLFLNVSNLTNIKESVSLRYPTKISKHFKSIRQSKIKNSYEEEEEELSSFKSFDEELFLFKLDFMLNEIFDNFFEDINPVNSLNKSTFSLKPTTLSDSIREIFYMKNALEIKDNFVLKGIYYCDINSFINNRKLKRKNYSSNKNIEKNINLDEEKEKIITIELYFRKIFSGDSEIIEFYFNDITLISKIEKEKAENKIRSLILAKISHEFKTPLITIIYILKNYINTQKAEISINNKKYPGDNLQNNNIIYNGSNNLSFEKFNTYTSLNNNGNNTNNDFETSLENKEKYQKQSTIIKTKENYLKNTIDLSDYMLSLINDIIDFSVIDSNFDLKFQFDSFNIYNLLNFSFRILNILIDCKGLGRFIKTNLEIDENVPHIFYSDEMRIKQVLLNLISNSIKFTRRGFIKIIAKLVEFGKIEISVEDTGIGISPSDLKKLFTDFGKIQNDDSVKMNKIGSGLGLSICRKIIGKLGTQISVESIPNIKTRFFFVILNRSKTKTSEEAKFNNLEISKKINYSDNRIGNSAQFSFSPNNFALNYTNNMGNFKNLSTIKNSNNLFFDNRTKSNFTLIKNLNDNYNNYNNQDYKDDFNIIDEDSKEMSFILTHKNNYSNDTQKNTHNKKYEESNNKFDKNKSYSNGNEESFGNNRLSVDKFRKCENKVNNLTKSFSDTEIYIDNNYLIDHEKKHIEFVIKGREIVKNIYNKKNYKLTDFNSTLKFQPFQDNFEKRLDSSKNKESKYKSKFIRRYSEFFKKKQFINGKVYKTTDVGQISNILLKQYNLSENYTFSDNNDLQYKGKKTKVNLKKLDENKWIDCTNENGINLGKENLDDKTFRESSREAYFYDTNTEKIILGKNINYGKNKPHAQNLLFRDNSLKYKMFHENLYSEKRSSSKENLIKININNNFNSFNNFNQNQKKFMDGFLKVENNISLMIENKNIFLEKNSEMEIFFKPIKKYMKKNIEKIILIVDDNEIIRKSIKKQIKSIYKDEKISVVCLGDGIELIYLVMIDQIMKNLIKLIISDEQMIYLNGSESYKMLNSMYIEKRINKIPFVICSSNGDQQSNFANEIMLDKDHKNMSISYLNKPPSKAQIKSVFDMFNV